MTAEQVFSLAGYARHRPWCPEADGPADCTCGLYTLLDSIQCGTCGHKVSIHTNRDVSDVVGWPCSECRSKRCHGFTLAVPSDAPEKPACGWTPGCDRPGYHDGPCLPPPKVPKDEGVEDWSCIDCGIPLEPGPPPICEECDE